LYVNFRAKLYYPASTIRSLYFLSIYIILIFEHMFFSLYVEKERKNVMEYMKKNEGNKVRSEKE